MNWRRAHMITFVIIRKTRIYLLLNSLTKWQNKHKQRRRYNSFEIFSADAVMSTAFIFSVIFIVVYNSLFRMVFLYSCWCCYCCFCPTSVSLVTIFLCDSAFGSIYISGIRCLCFSILMFVKSIHSSFLGVQNE